MSSNFGASLRRRITPINRQLRDAAGAGNTARVAGLLAKGANVNAGDDRGYTALHWASCNGHVDAIEWLLSEGADVKATNNLGDTPLHCAVYCEHVAAVTALLAQGADVNAENNDRWTPLHYASSHGHRGVAMTLLAQGGDPDALDSDGNTPVDLAESSGKGDVLGLLLDTVRLNLESALPVPPQHKPGYGGDLEARLAALKDDGDDEPDVEYDNNSNDNGEGDRIYSYNELAARFAALKDEPDVVNPMTNQARVELGEDGNLHTAAIYADLDLAARLAALKDEPYVVNSMMNQARVELGEDDNLHTAAISADLAEPVDGDRRPDEPDAANPSPSQTRVGVGKDDYLLLKMILELAKDGVVLPAITEDERTALKTLAANMPDLERSLESVRGLPPSLTDRGDGVAGYFFFFGAAFERLFVAAQAIASGACKVDPGAASNVLEAALGVAGWAAEGSNLPFAGFVGIFSAVIKHQAETKKANSLEAFVEFFRGNSRDQYLLTYRKLAEQFCLQLDISFLAKNGAASTDKLKERVKDSVIVPVQKYLRKVHLDSIRALSPVEEKAMSDLASITEEVLRLHQSDKETYDQLRFSNEQAKASYFLAQLFGKTELISPTSKSDSSTHSSPQTNSSKPPPHEGQADPEDAEPIQLLTKKVNEMEELKESFQSHINTNANLAKDLERTQAQVRMLAAKVKSKKDITLSSGRQAQAQLDPNIHKEDAKKVEDMDRALVQIERDLRNLHVKYSQDMAKLKVENFIDKKLISRHEAFEVMRKIISLARRGDGNAIVVSEDGSFVLDGKGYRIGVVRTGRPFAKKKILWKGNEKIKLEEEHLGAKSVMHWFNETNLCALYERKKWEAIRAVFAEELEELSIPDTTRPNHQPCLEDDRDELFHTGLGLR